MATDNVTAPKSYSIQMIFNGKTFKKRTTDLAKAILSFKPDVVNTEGYITITKGEYVFERRLNLLQLKKLFNNEDILNAFITNILI